MKLSLDRSELAILVLHMNIMRKPIKKGFKSNYGHFEGRKMIKEYDALKEQLEHELNEEIELVNFEFNEQETNMLYSFLKWYVLEIKLSAEVQGANVERDEQILILEKINRLVDTAAENWEEMKYEI
jgi:hypothetical protein